MKPLTEEHIAEVKSHFDFFDTDKNGQIDIKEFGKLLQLLSPDASEEQIKNGFDWVDSNHDTHIEFDEFLEWWETCWWEF
ncbi:MAG: EF-hand domain-containing protein [Kangiellaceae bacterium]|nr:EF-hand domain-containing protein [Kangiellaceae bacterium]